MNESKDKSDEPFGGEGPVNLSRKQLYQAWHLSKILEYQRKVRELTERQMEQEMER